MTKSAAAVWEIDEPMTPKRSARRQYRCKSCGAMLPASGETSRGVDVALSLGPVSPRRTKPYLRRMETECINTVVVEAYEVVNGEDDGI
jgi:hypothetical protein